MLAFLDGGAGLLLILLGTVLTATSVGVTTYAAVDASNKADEMGKWQAEQANNQAIAIEQQAQADAKLVRDKNLRILSSQRTDAAKSGRVLSGSVADVINDSEIQGELDVLNLLYKGQVSASQMRTEGLAARYKGGIAKTQGLYQGVGSALGGLASSASLATHYPKFKTSSGSISEQAGTIGDQR